MTIRFLQPWGGYQIGSRASLAPADETRLINSGLARADYVQDGVTRRPLEVEIPSDGEVRILAGDASISGIEKSILDFDLALTTDGTVDCGPALRAAAVYFASVGGGTLKIPRGLWKASTLDTAIEWPKDQWHVVNFGANVTVQGEAGAVFWLDGATISPQPGFVNGTKRFNAIALKGANSRVSGLRFTTNGWVLNQPVAACHGVTIGADNCEVSRCYFYQMPGRNVVRVGYDNLDYPGFVIFPKNAKVIRNIFQNGHSNIPGNTNSDDCSFVYVYGDGATVERNKFYNDTAPLSNCGGVEAHGTRIQVVNNWFENLWPAAYMGFQSTDGKVSQDNKFHRNFVIACNGGVQTIDESVGWEVTKNYFENVVTTSNALGYGTAIFSTLSGTTGATAGYQRQAKISENVIWEATPILKNAINIAGLQNSTIAENTFYGVSPCIAVRGGADVVTDGVQVINNICTKPPAAPAYSTGIVFVGGADNYASTISNVWIHGNKIVADVGTTNTSSVVAAGTQTTFSNIKAWDNDVVNCSDSCQGNMASNVAFEPVGFLTHAVAWTQSGGTQPALGNGTMYMRWRRKGKSVTVWFNFTAGSTTTFGNSSYPWRFSLPVKGSGVIADQGFTMEVANGTTSKFVYGRVSGSAFFDMSVDGANVRLDYPFTSVSGMTIRGSFTYLTD